MKVSRLKCWIEGEFPGNWVRWKMHLCQITKNWEHSPILIFPPHKRLDEIHFANLLKVALVMTNHHYFNSNITLIYSLLLLDFAQMLAKNYILRYLWFLLLLSLKHIFLYTCSAFVVKYLFIFVLVLDSSCPGGAQILAATETRLISQ